MPKLGFWIVVFFTVRLVAESPYTLNTWNEMAWSAAGGAIGTCSLWLDARLQPLTEADIQKLDVQAINRFDRFAVHCYHEPAAKVSDYLLLTCTALPVLTFAQSDIQNNAETIAWMYAETLLFTSGLTNLTKVLVKRNRPFTYNANVPLTCKLEPDARKSFFSGHTSMAFAAATYTATVVSDYSDSPALIWGGCMTLASSVAICRVWGGQHFPTDVITGALVGGLVGYTVPCLHRENTTKNERSVPCLRFSFRW